MLTIENYPTSREIRDFALTLEDEEEVKFSVQGIFFYIFLRSDGEYDVNLYEEEEDMDDGDTIDGGACSGCSVDAIEFMLPDRIPTGNGAKNSFYDISEAKDVDDLAELWDLDFFQGNQLKTLLANVGARHMGTTKLREAKKSLHYGGRRVAKEERSDEGEVVDDNILMAEMINEMSVEAQRVVVSKLEILKTYMTKD